MLKIKSSKLPKVSFLIPTLNAGSILPLCLEKIKHQKYPSNKIEIIIADGGSNDQTLSIAKKYHARIVKNPEVLHEPGKDRASKVATGKIFFFTDADNILSSDQWVMNFIKVYIAHPNITGFLPQTIPAPNSNSLDRYMGYLSTDPFTWFVYRNAATPRTYGNLYIPQVKSKKYTLYEFNVNNHPLMGFSQGFGVVASFKRGRMGHSDDILAAIKLVSEGGSIVHVSSCGVYHYHVKGLRDFINKYTWRIRNNFYQKVKGMGLVNRQQYLNIPRKIRQVLFVPYSFSFVFPFIDMILLFKKYKDKDIFWHPFACIILLVLILKESFLFSIGVKRGPGTYGQKN
jgi:glycosyltransferase involved in cell wall biosynthesis